MTTPVEDSTSHPTSPVSTARCVVVDDHPIVRKGMVALLQELGDLEVVGEAGDVPAARIAIEQFQPDILIIDLVLKGISAIDFVKELRVRFPVVKILVVSMMDEIVYGPRLLKAGAHGFIMKGVSAEQLKSAIGTVLEGGIYLNPLVTTTLIRSGAPTSSGEAGRPIAEVLTDRELEIFRQIGEGLASREIANGLSISNRTVDAHKANIRSKLNLRSMAELNKLAALWNDESAQ
ncbi:MAG: response regulator transcription factor [Verrucomicrobiales bacterium]